MQNDKKSQEAVLDGVVAALASLQAYGPNDWAAGGDDEFGPREGGPYVKLEDVQELLARQRTAPATQHTVLPPGWSVVRRDYSASADSPAVSTTYQLVSPNSGSGIFYGAGESQEHELVYEFLQAVAGEGSSESLLFSQHKAELNEFSAKVQVELQRMFDTPADAIEQAFRDSTLVNGSQPKEWEQSIPPMVWYGWNEFKKGYAAHEAHPVTTRLHEAVLRDGLLAASDAFKSIHQAGSLGAARNLARVALLATSASLSHHAGMPPPKAGGVPVGYALVPEAPYEDVLSAMIGRDYSSFKSEVQGDIRRRYAAMLVVAKGLAPA